MVGVALLRNGRRIAMSSLQRGYLGSFPEQAVEALNHQRGEHAPGVDDFLAADPNSTGPVGHTSPATTG
jgi:hypothetical protein